MHNGNGQKLEIPEPGAISSGVPCQLPPVPGDGTKYDWDWDKVSPTPLPEPEDQSCL